MKTKSNSPPKFGADPSSKKIPRAEALPNPNLFPEFRTDKMDMDGKWGWSNFTSDNIQDLLSKLFAFQKSSWSELRQKGSHLVKVSEINQEARKRLGALELDDYEELYSLRLSGKQRVWGLKENSIFWILWWDPEHEVCPSIKS